MASIYINGVEIDEVNDDVYVNGTPLAIGKSVYLNGSVVWTKQVGCNTSTSGTSVSQYSATGQTITSTSWTTYVTKTVNSGICSGSQCSVRVGTLSGNLGGEGGFVGASARIQKNGTTQVSVSGADNIYTYSSTVTVTINPSDSLTIQASKGDSTASAWWAANIWTGNSGSIF